MKRKCPNCNISFPPTNNRHVYCTVKCKNQHNKDKYKFSARKTNIKYNYGISWDTWLEMYNKQEGKCPICFKFCSIHPSHKREGLAVDHCHTTGKVRGLLCIACNSAIGQLKENPLIMQNAINYIVSHKQGNAVEGE